jgi:hypothetical protein
VSDPRLRSSPLGAYDVHWSALEIQREEGEGQRRLEKKGRGSVGRERREKGRERGERERGGGRTI